MPCLPLPHTVGVLVYSRNIHSFGKKNKHPARRCLAGKYAFHNAEFLTAFCCRHNLTLSLLQPIQTLCWCGHYRVQAQFVCPEVGQAAQTTVFLSSWQQGQDVEHSTLTPQLASGWPGELTQRGRRLTLTSPSYPLVNIRRA